MRTSRYVRKIRRANPHGRPALSFQFEDVPLDEARHMSRGPRMDAELYHALEEKIQVLDTTAARMALQRAQAPPQ
jgi:hypothetical protein